MEISDYIVVGSGCCGAIAAKTLIDKGIKLTLLDTGIIQDSTTTATSNSFIDIRKNDANQIDFLLGKNFESLGSLQKKNPVHLTPNRQFTTAKVEDYLIWEDGNFNPIESLAKGGLGNAWGLGSYVYSDNELKQTGLPISELRAAYQWLASFIGISGGNDSSANYANGHLFTPQQAIPLDFNGQRLWNKLQHKQHQFQQTNFVVGRTPLAISTQNTLNGELYKANDLDFYETGITAAFRPINTIQHLQKTGLLNYQANQLVMQFKERDGIVEVETLDISTNETKLYLCKKLILAAGALGTARIVMRSATISKLPLLCNPYTYIPSLQFPLLGAANTGYQTGLAQLSLYYDLDTTHTNIAMGSLYSYRSLMGFRLMREFPLDFKSGQQWVKFLQPALNITGVFHPEFPGTNKYMELVKDTTLLSGDKLKSCYQLNEQEEIQIVKTEQAFKKTLRQLGTVPLKVQRNKHGASIHYGGTLPFNSTQTPTHTNNGRLHDYQNIFVADGSGFQFLSGKGLTLTLMAYAHHVTKQASEC
jgi:hypothetical protein